MDIIIGLIMLLVFIGMGAYAFLTENFVFTNKYIAQLVISGLGAAYILTTNATKLLPKIKPDMNKDKNKDDDDIEVNLHDIEDKELMDYRVLLYLKKRAKEIQSDKALELVIELNNLLFSDGKSTK
jgi:hypothetical protein